MSESAGRHLAKYWALPYGPWFGGPWCCVTRLRGDQRHSLASCDLVCTSDESVLSWPPPQTDAMLSYVAGGFK